jgi:hypothetical protein
MVVNANTINCPYTHVNGISTKSTKKALCIVACIILIMADDEMIKPHLIHIIATSEP